MTWDFGITLAALFVLMMIAIYWNVRLWMRRRIPEDEEAHPLPAGRLLGRQPQGGILRGGVR